MKAVIKTYRKDKLLLISGILAVCIFICISAFTGNIDNTTESKDLPETINPNITELVINEVMSNNGGVYANEYNEQCDYIELYNGTSKAINLKSYGLSDRKDKIKWVFSDVTIEPYSYLVVGLTGNIEDGNNASFKLSSKGNENVILTNPSGKVIDAVTTLSLGKGQAMVRDEYGEWYVADYGTPGFENSVKGRNEYLESITKPTEMLTLVVNELLPTNRGNFTNEYGRQDGFIELINVSSVTINLSDYTISNTSNAPFKVTLPNKELAPKEIYYLYLGDGDYSEENYLGFGFSSDGGSVYIGQNGKIIYKLDYNSMSNGCAYTRSENGLYYVTSVVSAGQANTVEGIAKFQRKFLKTPDGLIISEVITENYQYLAQNGNRYYDYVELYNNSDKAINLGNYYLSNTPNNLNLYKLPDVNLNSHERIVIMCSGDTNLTNQTYYHANFKIGSYDGIYLSISNTLVDSIFIGDTPQNYSYGRYGDSGLYYMVPTPLKENNSGQNFVSPKVEWNITGGVFNDTDSLSIALEGTGKIYYTTNGDAPSINSKIYTGPITVKKTCVIKAINIEDGSIASDLTFNSYIMNENHTMPVVSVSMNADDLTILNRDLWKNFHEWQAYIEFYEDDGSFSTPCSISLFGGNARSYAKKSYAIRFKDVYGAETDLNYALFDNRDNSSYDAIVLRGGSSDYKVAMMRDEVAGALVDQYTDLDVQAYRYSILYINGQYWGIYCIKEKCNAHLIEDHYNVSSEGLNFTSITGEIKAGSTEYYNSIRQFAINNDLTIAENYQWICDHVNIENFVDYWIAQSFTANNDLFNVRFFSSPYIDDGKLKYYFYDMDYGMYWYYNNYYVYYIGKEGGMTAQKYENDIIRNLLPNKDFQALWLERLNYHMHYTWNKTNFLNKIDELYNILLPEMPRNQERWNLTMAQWNEGVNYLRKFGRNREYYLLAQTKNYFRLSNAKMKEIFGDLW